MGFFEVLGIMYISATILVGIGYALKDTLPVLNCMQSMNRKVYTPIWIVTVLVMIGTADILYRSIMLQSLFGLTSTFWTVLVIDILMLTIFMYSGIRRMYHIIPPYSLYYMAYVFFVIASIIMGIERLWIGLIIVQLLVWLLPALKLPKLQNDPRNLETKK